MSLEWNPIQSYIGYDRSKSQPTFLERDPASRISDDEMIHHGNVQEFTGLYDFHRRRDIVGTRRWVARRMRMGDNDRGAVLPDRVTE